MYWYHNHINTTWLCLHNVYGSNRGYNSITMWYIHAWRNTPKLSWSLGIAPYDNNSLWFTPSKIDLNLWERISKEMNMLRETRPWFISLHSIHLMKRCLLSCGYPLYGNARDASCDWLRAPKHDSNHTKSP